MAERAQIRVKGVVQGVGFRPYVFNLALSLSLKGYVTNTAEGVTVDVEGEKVAEFIGRLAGEAPPLSRITELSVCPLPEKGYADFTIVESEDQDSLALFTFISPDVSVCDDCLRELLDPSDRRYLYPFINCTNCGPRYSITKAVPYDRPNTTMHVFQMCRACSAEYRDPRNRRFHAQPNACPQCGPELDIRTPRDPAPLHPPFDKGARGRDKGAPIEKAIGMLKGGAIVAIKGLGGFHIACDAMNEGAVERLRERKRRSNKPFALMTADVDTIRRFCEVSEEERALLESNRRPIVLLRKRERMESPIPEGVSPQNRYLGFMLPYTPLHYLLFHYPPLDPSVTKGGQEGATHFDALVMTSGNLSEEPIMKDNAEAVEELSGLVDAFLIHNRDIFMRVDDSVVRIVKGGREGIVHSWPGTHRSSPSFIRRSRGYTPEAIPLHTDGPEVLGCGADIKNCFTVTKGSFAIPSQHIGDMENYETLGFYEECLRNLTNVYRVRPVALGHDLHPGYLTTQWAARQNDIPKFEFQHHYAHIASVMAENGSDRDTIGVVFDGTGYGTDGTLWGGEFIIAGIEGFERVAHLKPVPLPGGEQAIREPWRTAASYILSSVGDMVQQRLEEIGLIQRCGEQAVANVLKVAGSSEISPLSSGMGRLFDAISSLIGICDRNTFEGEAAMALESLTAGVSDEEYAVSFSEGHPVLVDFSQTIVGVMDDHRKGVSKQLISTKFHNTVSGVILNVVDSIAERSGLRDVALGGGTFQNIYLMNRTFQRLAARGFRVLVNRAVPCNDACISLGQAYLVRERIKRR